MKKKNLEQFDEREVHIRNRIYQRGFILLSALVVADWFLAILLTNTMDDLKIHSILGGVVCFMIALTVVVMELTVRGVYFSRKENNPRVNLVLMLLGVAASVAGIVFVNLQRADELFFQDWQLTMRGVAAVSVSLFALICLFAAIRAMRDIQNHKQAITTQEETP